MALLACALGAPEGGLFAKNYLPLV